MLLLWIETDGNVLLCYVMLCYVMLCYVMLCYKQCCKTANDANWKLGMIERWFKNKSKEILLPLYKSMIRPHMDSCIQAWRPHFRKNVDRLEMEQRRATKMMEGLEGLGYLERLRILNLTTLETRFPRADLIEIYTIFKGLNKLDPGRFFDVVDGATHDHSLKLFKRRVRLDVGKYKFGNRVCDEWSGLAEEVVMAGSLVTFQAKLDHHLRNVRGFV